MDAWQLAKEIVAKKRVGEMRMGLFQPGTLVSFCYQGQARLGVIHSTDPKLDAAGVAAINAEVDHLNTPGLRTNVRKESEMCLILRNVFDTHKEFLAKKKEKEDA